MTAPRNVLFITLDQWRGDCLSVLGHPCLRTPHLDALARDGALFEAHYSQSTPCGPGRASLYTGLYLKNHRSVMNGTPLSRHWTNVALEVQRAGYEPALFGYTDTAADPRDYPPDDPALNTYEGILPGMNPVVHLDSDQSAWAESLEAQGYEVPWRGYDLFRPKSQLPTAQDSVPIREPAFYHAEHSITAFLTGEAKAYIEQCGDRPWFAHLSYFAPHPPWFAPAPYHEMYDPADVPLPVRAATPEQEAESHPWLWQTLPCQHGMAPWQGLQPEDRITLSETQVRQIRAVYYGLISELDDQIGSLIEQLKALDQYDRTLIVITSDHGELLGDHWTFGKLGYFDSAFHVPLILRDPTGTPGRRINRFTENVDIMPTILDYLGLSVPAQCDGRSLLPFCRGEVPSNWRQEAHWEYDFRNITTRHHESAFGLTSDQCNLAVLRGERYKYVHFAALPPLFFDLEDDPKEFNNLADHPDYRGLVLDHAQKMISWRMVHESRDLTHKMLTPEGVVTSLEPRW